jgi:hypothetical protein
VFNSSRLLLVLRASPARSVLRIWAGCPETIKTASDGQIGQCLGLVPPDHSARKLQSGRAFASAHARRWLRCLGAGLGEPRQRQQDRTAED